MSLTYFGMSTVLSAFLLILLCAAALWLLLDSCALWRQFRGQQTIMEARNRHSVFDRIQHFPSALGEDRVSRSGLRVIVFKQGNETDPSRARASGPRLRSLDR